MHFFACLVFSYRTFIDKVWSWHLITNFVSALYIVLYRATDRLSSTNTWRKTTMSCYLEALFGWVGAIFFILLYKTGERHQTSFSTFHKFCTIFAFNFSSIFSFFYSYLLLLFSLSFFSFTKPPLNWFAKKLLKKLLFCYFYLYVVFQAKKLINFALFVVIFTFCIQIWCC